MLPSECKSSSTNHNMHYEDFNTSTDNCNKDNSMRNHINPGDKSESLKSKKVTLEVILQQQKEDKQQVKQQNKIDGFKQQHKHQEHCKKNKTEKTTKKQENGKQQENKRKQQDNTKHQHQKVKHKLDQQQKQLSKHEEKLKKQQQLQQQQLFKQQQHIRHQQQQRQIEQILREQHQQLVYPHPDPLKNCSTKFMRRISEIAILEAETKRFENSQAKYKKK